MWTYTAPWRDMQFVIEAVLAAASGWTEMPAFTDLDAERDQRRRDVDARLNRATWTSRSRTPRSVTAS